MKNDMRFPPLLPAGPGSARTLAVAALFAGLFASGEALAEPVLDRALSGVQLVARKSCAIIRVGFNFRIRYGSHFPIGRGDELRVSVQAIDPDVARALSLLKREALRAPSNRTAPIKAIDLEANGQAGPVLRILFDAPVAYKVAQGADFESIVIAISGKVPSATCKPEFPALAGGEWATTVSPAQEAREAAPEPRGPTRNMDRKPGAAVPADVAKIAGWMDESRAALKAAKYGEAIRLLTKILSYPENEHSAGAQELLGVAYQKNRQLAEARAEYEDYLARYPGGEGAEGVRQRLDGIVTAESGPRETLRAGKEQGANGAGESAGSTWSMSGSASQFYIRDDSFRALRDPSLPPDLTDQVDDHLIHQNALLSSFDATAMWSNGGLKSKLRFSGTEEHDFDSEAEYGDIISVAALFLDMSSKELGASARLGRQTRNTGGVLGRFDGGLASWQASPSVRLNAVAGSPVARRKDEPFEDDKYFYGASIDMNLMLAGLDGTLFAIEQRDRDALDRQAVGAELRYVDSSKSAFATIDYDVHYGILNAAILSGSWTFPDKSTLQAAADYRRAPYISTENALQGQPFLTLYDMLRLHTTEEVERFALDNTPTYKSATLGFSRPIASDLQINLDATVSEMSAPAALNGAVTASSADPEIYASAQIMSTNFVTNGDMYIAALRFADRADSNLYVIDLSARYPLTDSFRINPRLRLGYREGQETDLTEYSVLPSLLLNYYWTRDLNLEIEAGANWTERRIGQVEESETEFFFTGGYRYDFYADPAAK